MVVARCGRFGRADLLGLAAIEVLTDGVGQRLTLRGSAARVGGRGRGCGRWGHCRLLSM